MSDWLDFKSVKQEANLELVLRLTVWTCGAAARPAPWTLPDSPR
jgi:hypothetical protein